jgi:hypothetical protein
MPLRPSMFIAPQRVKQPRQQENEKPAPPTPTHVAVRLLVLGKRVASQQRVVEAVATDEEVEDHDDEDHGRLGDANSMIDVQAVAEVEHEDGLRRWDGDEEAAVAGHEEDGHQDDIKWRRMNPNADAEEEDEEVEDGQEAHDGSVVSMLKVLRSRRAAGRRHVTVAAFLNLELASSSDDQSRRCFRGGSTTLSELAVACRRLGHNTWSVNHSACVYCSRRGSRGDPSGRRRQRQHGASASTSTSGAAMKANLLLLP